MAVLLVAVSEATLVVYKTTQSELRGEVIGKSIQIHLFESTPAMGHHQAWYFVCGGLRREEPSSEFDVVGRLEGDVALWHVAENVLLDGTTSSIILSLGSNLLLMR